MRIGSRPPEADAPLIVDADAVLPAPVPPELLEPVARWDPEVVQGHGCVELPQLAEGDSLHLRPQLPDRLSIEQSLRVSIAEGPNHGGMITPRVISGKDGAGVGLTKCASAAGLHPPATQHLTNLGCTHQPVTAEYARRCRRGLGRFHGV